MTKKTVLLLLLILIIAALIIYFTACRPKDEDFDGGLVTIDGLSTSLDSTNNGRAFQPRSVFDTHDGDIYLVTLFDAVPQGTTVEYEWFRIEVGENLIPVRETSFVTQRDMVQEYISSQMDAPETEPWLPGNYKVVLTGSDANGKKIFKQTREFLIQ